MTSFERRLPSVARIALGLVFFVFGLDGFTSTDGSNRDLVTRQS